MSDAEAIESEVRRELDDLVDRDSDGDLDETEEVELVGLLILSLKSNTSSPENNNDYKVIETNNAWK